MKKMMQTKNLKSPITGGEMILMTERSKVTFRNEEVEYTRKYFHCVDSGQNFTDTELDNDNMWAIFRAYWERRGFEHFYDIDGYRKEQEPISDNLDKAFKQYAEENHCDTTIETSDGGMDYNNFDDLYDACVYGAKMQKEQMMKDAIETTIDGKVVKVIVIDE